MRGPAAVPEPAADTDTDGSTDEGRAAAIAEFRNRRRPAGRAGGRLNPGQDEDAAREVRTARPGRAG